MLTLECAEIVSHGIETTQYKTRFVELERLEPELVRTEGRDVYFRLGRLSYEPGESDADKAYLFDADFHGYQLKVVGEERHLSPVALAFDPTRYFPKGKFISLKEAQNGTTIGDKMRQVWMERHGLDEAIVGRDDQCYPKPDGVVLPRPMALA